MTPTKQTVYLPVIAEYPTDKRFDDKEGYFFTPEQLNEYTQGVIKQTLETAAEEAYTAFEFGAAANNHGVNSESITNTFEETFKKFEV